jgi:hypothetical protein
VGVSALGVIPSAAGVINRGRDDIRRDKAGENNERVLYFGPILWLVGAGLDLGQHLPGEFADRLEDHAGRFGDNGRQLRNVPAGGAFAPVVSRRVGRPLPRRGLRFLTFSCGPYYVRIVNGPRRPHVSVNQKAGVRLWRLARKLIPRICNVIPGHDYNNYLSFSTS